MPDIIVPVSIGVAATAFFWILCAIIVRLRAKARKEQQEDTVEKISHILGAAFKGAKLLDEEESLQYVKSAEDLMNKNMPILGTDFLILLDKHLQLLKDYIREVKTAMPKPAEKVKEKTKETPKELKQNAKPQTRIEVNSKPEVKLEIPQTKTKVETKEEVKQEIKPQIRIETDDVKQQVAASEKTSIRIETDDADRTAIKVERKLIDGLFPTPEIKIKKPKNDKNIEEHISEKTSYLPNATQEFQMKDIIKESAKK